MTKSIIKLKSTLTSVSEFSAIFPDTIILKPDKEYKILLELKITILIILKNSVILKFFPMNLVSDSLLLSQMKTNNENYLNQFSKSLDKQLDLNNNLNKLKQSQDFKKAISYSDQQRINEYIKQQNNTDEFFKKFSEHFKKQLAITPETSLDKSLQKRINDFQKSKTNKMHS